MASLTQQDLVDKDDKLNDPGSELQDRVTFPNLAEHFEISGDSFKEERRTYSPLKKSASKTRREVAEDLVDLLKTGKDVAGFEWEVGSERVQIIKCTDGTVEHKIDEDDLKDLMFTALRCRPLINRIRWELGKPYMEIDSTQL